MKPTIVLAMAVSAVLLSIIAHQLVAVAGDEPEVIENGDANGDGNRDLADAIYMLHWLFHGGEEPIAIDCNVDQSARIAELERQLATANAESEAILQRRISEMIPNGWNFENFVRDVGDTGYTER